MDAPIWKWAASAAAAAAGAVIVWHRLTTKKDAAPVASGASAPEHKADGHKGHLRADNSIDLPTDKEGRVMHLQVRQGEVANRILSVGDAGRAEKIAAAMFDDCERFVHSSSRGFKVYTGTFKGIPVSIIATGMGTAMIDFVVRECAAIVPGQMAIVRLGTCGGLGSTEPGNIVVASKGAVLVRREPDLAHAEASSDSSAASGDGGASGSASCPYSISKVVPADEELSRRYAVSMRRALKATKGSDADLSGYSVIEGVGATADSFYSSQGRKTAMFDDRNTGVVDKLERTVPDAAALEMETFHLLSLAKSSRGKIAASSATIPIVGRHSGKWLPSEHLRPMELAGGEAAMDALTSMPLKDCLTPEELGFGGTHGGEE